MRVEGTFDVGAPRQTVYDFIIDPARASKCIPGIQNPVLTSTRDFVAVVETDASRPVEGDFIWQFFVIEESPPEHLKFMGHGKGMRVDIDMEFAVHLDEIDSNNTSLSWTCDAKMGGLIPSAGNRSISRRAEKTAVRFIDALRATLSQRQTRF